MTFDHWDVRPLTFLRPLRIAFYYVLISHTNLHSDVSAGHGEVGMFLVNLRTNYKPGHHHTMSHSPAPALEETCRWEQQGCGRCSWVGTPLVLWPLTQVQEEGPVKFSSQGPWLVACTRSMDLGRVCFQSCFVVEVYLWLISSCLYSVMMKHFFLWSIA